MQVLENKALLMNVRRPDRITSLIEHSANMGEVDGADGVYQIAVKWTHANVHILTQLGLKNVPSTINKEYKWTGMFTPMSHQRDTASFIVNNPKCFVFNEAGCVDSSTEYLSPTGWVRIADYAGGGVAQFIPETGEAQFVSPTEFVKKPCATMIRFKSTYGVDQLLSPEHRVLHYKTDRNESDKELFWRVDSAEKLASGLLDKSISAVHFKTTYTPVVPTAIPLDDAQLRLQIAVIADGYFGSGTNHCVVRLKRERKVLRLRHLLDDAGVSYEETTPDYKGAEGFHIFKFCAPRRVKKFDSFFWQASTAQLQLVVAEVPHWDGSFRKSDGVAFYSTEKESVDFVQHAFISTGKVARITDDGRGCWQVYVRANARLIGMTNRHQAPDISYVPSTDGFKYCFSVPSTYLVFRRNGCVFVSGNTGKTAAAAWATDYLFGKGMIKRVLIVCPLSIMQAAWQQDLFKVVMHRKVGIAHGTPKARKAIIQGKYDYVVINYDGIEVVLDELKAGGFDCIIVDECNHLKNPSTDRWRAFKAILNDNTRLIMMTGTPAAQSPEDAYGLAKLVCPDKVPRFFGAWKDMVMQKISMFKWAPRPGAKDTVFRALQPAIRFTKEECLDLPDMVYETRHVPLTAQQEKYYHLLKKQMMIELAGEEVSAVNAAVQLNKLLQISCGAVYADDGSTILMDISKRLNELVAVIEESSHKVIVFAPFRHAIEQIEAHLNKKKISCGVINGDVSAGKRTTLFADFQYKTDPRVLIIQPQAAAHGVTLTAASTVVWFGPTSSVETYIQANARAHRKGQENKVTIVMLEGSPAEHKVYDVLNQKIDSHQRLVDLYKDILSD